MKWLLGGFLIVSFAFNAHQWQQFHHYKQTTEKRLSKIKKAALKRLGDFRLLHQRRLSNDAFRRKVNTDTSFTLQISQGKFNYAPNDSATRFIKSYLSEIPNSDIWGSIDQRMRLDLASNKPYDSLIGYILFGDLIKSLLWENSTSSRQYLLSPNPVLFPKKSVISMDEHFEADIIPFSYFIQLEGGRVFVNKEEVKYTDGIAKIRITNHHRGENHLQISTLVPQPGGGSEIKTRDYYYYVK